MLSIPYSLFHAKITLRLPMLTFPSALKFFRNKNNQLNNLCRGICSLTATFWSLRLVPESNLREQALKVSNCGRRSCDVITTDLYLNKVRDTESSCVFPQFRDYLFSRFTRQQTSKHLHIDVCVFTVFLRRFSKEESLSNNMPMGH